MAETCDAAAGTCVEVGTCDAAAGMFAEVGTCDAATGMFAEVAYRAAETEVAKSAVSEEHCETMNEN